MNSRPNPNCGDEDTLRRLCMEALQNMETVLAAKGRERYQVVDYGERALSQLRDCLIMELRKGEGPQSARLRTLLNQVNTALSLVVGVEYPGAGIQEKLLAQARDIVQSLSL